MFNVHVWSVQLWTDFNFDTFLTLSDENQKSTKVQIICLLSGNDTVSKHSTEECANHWTVAFISCASKVMLKILCARLWHYVNQELPFVQTGFRKGRGARDQIASIRWIIEKQRNFRKTSLSVSSTTLKPLTVWITTNCGKLWESWEYQATLPVSWETSMWAKKQHLEPGMEQLIGSRLRKEYDRAIRSHPVCLPYELSTSWDILGWVSY